VLAAGAVVDLSTQATSKAPATGWWQTNTKCMAFDGAQSRFETGGDEPRAALPFTDADDGLRSSSSNTDPFEFLPAKLRQTLDASISFFPKTVTSRQT